MKHVNTGAIKPVNFSTGLTIVNEVLLLINWIALCCSAKRHVEFFNFNNARDWIGIWWVIFRNFWMYAKLNKNVREKLGTIHLLKHTYTWRKNSDKVWSGAWNSSLSLSLRPYQSFVQVWLLVEQANSYRTEQCGFGQSNIIDW